MVFDSAKRNKRFGCIQCQRGKKSNSRGKRKRRVFLCRWTVGVKVGGKVIPASFLKVEGRRTLVGKKTGKKGTEEGLVGDQNPGHEAPPRSKRGGSKGDIRGGATKNGAM